MQFICYVRNYLLILSFHSVFEWNANGLFEISNRRYVCSTRVYTGRSTWHVEENFHDSLAGWDWRLERFLSLLFTCNSSPSRILMNVWHFIMTLSLWSWVCLGSLFTIIAEFSPTQQLILIVKVVCDLQLLCQCYDEIQTTGQVNEKLIIFDNIW